MQIAIRFERELIDRVDAFIERLKEREPDAPWSRGAAIRRLMRAALDREGITGGRNAGRSRRGG